MSELVSEPVSELKVELEPEFVQEFKQNFNFRTLKRNSNHKIKKNHQKLKLIQKLIRTNHKSAGVTSV